MNGAASEDHPSKIGQNRYPARLLNLANTQVASSTESEPTLGFVITRRKPASVNAQTPQSFLPDASNHFVTVLWWMWLSSVKAISTLTSARYFNLRNVVLLSFLHHLGRNHPAIDGN